MGKFDAALTLALGQPDDGSDAPFDITVLVQQPLSAALAKQLQGLGVAADEQRTVFAGQVTRGGLSRLARVRSVARVSLAQPLKLAAAGSGPLRSMSG